MYNSKKIFSYKMRLSIPPTIIVESIIIPADFSISLMPSSLSNTANVAMQGKYMVSTTEETIICDFESPSGISIPTATSFLRNPIMSAPTAPSGKPKTPFTIGAASFPIN